MAHDNIYIILPHNLNIGCLFYYVSCGLFYYVSCGLFYYGSYCQSFIIGLYTTLPNKWGKKFLSQYKLHANKHIYKSISLQLQVINSFKYAKMEIYH